MAEESHVHPALVLYAPDPTRTVAFYAALGLAFREERHSHGPLHHSARVGEMVIEVYPTDRIPEAGNSMVLAFPTADLSSTVARVQEAGIAVTGWPPPRDRGTVVLRDPDGRCVVLLGGAG